MASLGYKKKLRNWTDSYFFKAQALNIDGTVLSGFLDIGNGQNESMEIFIVANGSVSILASQILSIKVYYNDDASTTYPAQHKILDAVVPTAQTLDFDDGEIVSCYAIPTIQKDMVVSNTASKTTTDKGFKYVRIELDISGASNVGTFDVFLHYTPR